MNHYENIALLVWAIWSLLVVFTAFMIATDTPLPYSIGNGGGFYIWSIATVLVVIYFAFT